MPYTPPFRTRRSPQRLAEPHLGESAPGDDAPKKPLTWTTASAQPLADDPTRTAAPAPAPAPDDDDDALPVLTQLVEPPIVPPVMPPVIAPPVAPSAVSPAAVPPAAPLGARPVAPIAPAASLQPAAPPPPAAPTPPAPPVQPVETTLPAASVQPAQEPEDENEPFTEDESFAARQGVDEELVARITDEVLDALQPILHDLVGDAVRRALNDHIRQGGML